MTSTLSFTEKGDEFPPFTLLRPPQLYATADIPETQQMCHIDQSEK